jgi:hypothetical protein
VDYELTGAQQFEKEYLVLVEKIMCSRICPCKEDYKMYYTGNMTDEGDQILRKSNRSSSLDFMTSAEIDDY